MKLLHLTLRRFLIPLCFLSGAAIAALPGPFFIPQSQQSTQSTLTLAAPLYVDALVLTANVAVTQAIPTGARFVIFSSTCTFYVQRSGAAAVPGATTTTGVAAQLNPAAWFLANGETSFSMITPATGCVVTVSFYTP